MQAWAEIARSTDSILCASSATLAEVADGTASDARLRQVVKAVNLVDVDDSIGYRAGALRARAAKGRRKARDLTVDALVAATAIILTPPALVLASDIDDLRLLLTDYPVQVLAI